MDATADWLKVRELLVLDAGGATNRMSIDRMPLVALEYELSPHLVVYACAPEALHDAYGGTGYIYRYLQINLPGGELPAALRIGEQPFTPIEEAGIPACDADLLADDIEALGSCTVPLHLITRLPWSVTLSFCLITRAPDV